MADAQTNIDILRTEEPAIDVVSEKTRKRSFMYFLAQTVGEYAYTYFKNTVDTGESLTDAWRRFAYLLAAFNIQIYVKNKEETGRDGVVRIIFFITRGNPRPMTSFKLPAAYGRGFFLLDTHTRAICSRSFIENQKELKHFETFLKDFSDPSQRELAFNGVSNLLSQPACL